MDIQCQIAGVPGVLLVGAVLRPELDGRPPSSLNGSQISLDGGPDAVLGEQWIFPAGDHEALLSPQTEAQAVPVADFVAHVLHEQEEVAQVVGVRYGGAQILLQHGAEGGLAPGPAQPLNVADRLGGLPLEENGQAALPAQAI